MIKHVRQDYNKKNNFSVAHRWNILKDIYICMDKYIIKWYLLQKEKKKKRRQVVISLWS